MVSICNAFRIILSTAVLAALIVALPAAEPLQELRSIRDQMRARIGERYVVDAKLHQPREIVLAFDHGLKRGRPMQLFLHRIGDHWAAPHLEGAEVDDIDVSKLAMDGNRVTGSVTMTWTEAGADGEDDVVAKQTYAVDVTIYDIPRQLVLRFERFLGGPWVLAYAPKGDTWVYKRDVGRLVHWVDWGPFTREIPPLTAKADGTFQTTIKATKLKKAVGAGKKDGAFEKYEEHGHPVITASFSIVHDRIGGRWLRRAAGGKNMFGNGTDIVTGAIQSQALKGSFHAKGSRPERTGAITGSVLPGQSDTGPLDLILHDSEKAGVAVQAARIYRQILALDLVQKNYPMPLQAAIDRSLVPDPVTDGVADSEVQVYLASLLVHARKALAAKAKEVVTESSRPDDPAFGPFIDRKALAGNSLAVVADGPQEWAYPTNWQFCGPFAVYDQTAPVHHPEITTAALPMARSRMYLTADGEVIYLDDPATWIKADGDHALVAAPSIKAASSGGMPSFVWYAANTIDSRVAQTVWISLHTSGRSMLWLNDELVYRSLGNDDAVPAIFPIALKAGGNRLLMRVGNERYSDAFFNLMHYSDGYNYRPQGRIDFTTFTMFVCTVGKPGGQKIASKAVPAAVDGPVGYRNHWDGKFTDVEPPLAFDLDKGINVAWKQALPFGTADAVLRDGKLYVNAEPHHLFCIDAATGKILWRQASNALELVAPELIKEGDRLDDYVRAQAQIREWQALAKTQPKQAAVLKARCDQIEAQWTEFGNALKQLGIKPNYLAPATPVVSKDAVYVHYGTGAAACYDLSGKRRWMVKTAPWSEPGMGHPVLLDGKFIIQLHVPKVSGKRRYNRAFVVMALDAATGKQLWSAYAPGKRTVISGQYDRAGGCGNGIAAMTLASADGKTMRPLIVSGDGCVIDAVDGTILHRDIFPIEANRGGPMVQEDVVYAVSMIGECAVRLWLDAQGRVGAWSLWRTRHASGRGSLKQNFNYGNKHWMKGPLIHDNLIFQSLVDRGHVPQHHPLPWHEIDVWRTKDGVKVTRRSKVFENCTDPTVAPTLAGSYIAVADGGDPMPGFQGTTDYAQIAFIKADRSAIPVTRVKMDGKKLRAAPVFDGKRMFLRLYDGLYAIEVAGKDGKELVEKNKAETLFGEVPFREVPPPMKHIEPVPLAAAEGAPVNRLRTHGIPGSWLFCGPIPSAAPGDHLLALGGATKAQPVAGSAVTVGSKKYAFKAVEKKHFIGDSYGMLKALDALGPIKGRGSSVTYFYTVLDNPEVQVLRFNFRGQGLTAWLGGVEIEGNDLLSLKLGTYPLLIRSQVGRLPPFARNKKIGVAPTFQSAKHPALDYQAWVAKVEELRGRFEALIAKHKGTIIGGTARNYLRAVERYKEQEKK